MRKKLLFLNLIISMLVQAKLHTGDTFQIWEVSAVPTKLCF